MGSVIVIFQEGDGAEGRGVLTEIGGDVADLEAAGGVGCIVKWGEDDVQVLGVLAVPLAMLFQNDGGVVGGVVPETEDEIAVGDGVVGIEFDGAAVFGDGLGDAGDVFEGAGERVVQIVGAGRVFGDQFFVEVDRFFKIAARGQGVGEAAAGLGVIGLELQGGAEGVDGFVESTPIEERRAEIIVDFGSGS